MEEELDKLIEAQWDFLHQDWPVVKRTKFHRTDIKPVQDMRKIKDAVQHRLGVIPVFFFLTVLFGTRCYTGPYRNVDKGVLILYMLLQGTTVSDMGEFLPKSTFHDIFKSFFGSNAHTLDVKLTSCLAEMCSSIKLRLLCSRYPNPETFKHITLHLDGHDSRVAYRNADKKSMYSYKLKKSGFRTQVCCDMNSMVVFVSQPAECRDFNDGTMLSRMAIDKKIHQLDCLALDGGYTLNLEGMIAASDTLTSANFCYPIRKRKGIELTEEESRYNAVFGSFRSKYKLCCLLLNIKRMVVLRNITTEQHHSFWLQDHFDFPDGEENTLDMQAAVPSFKAKANDAKSIYRLQENFLQLAVSGHDTDQEMDNEDSQDYVVQKILSHRGEGEAIEYHVLWKGFDASHATWEVASQFNDKRTIEDYWNSLRTF
ncbi:hypothetical protein EDD21DRAFT_422650 [Dissophora ornata]|nr:hypothetical protein EDD21DRAFT_422650 [Dissophora ornata]